MAHNDHHDDEPGMSLRQKFEQGMEEPDHLSHYQRTIARIREPEPSIYGLEAQRRRLEWNHE